MNLNSIEWAKAQEFLLKLVQVLEPVASQTGASQAAVFGLPRQFFIPPSGEISKFKFDARLLITLHDAKKEVEDWIEKLPEIQEGFQTPADETPKGFIGNRTEEKFLSPKREGDGDVTKATDTPTYFSSNEQQPKIKTAAYAQKVMEQVRQAIQTLSTSSYLTDPKAEPLKKELKRLKPLIEQLIAAVAHEKPVLPSKADEESPRARFRIFPSEREARLKRLISFSLDKKETFLRRSFADPYLCLEVERTESKQRKEKTISNTSKEAKEENVPRSSKNSVELHAPQEVPVTEAKEFKTGEKAGEKIRSFEQKTLSAAPFPSQPQSSSNTSSRKGKKKRKSFWFREEEEPEKGS